MATDSIIMRGFRTGATHFTETTYGSFNITSTQCYKIGGKVKGVNWQTRQNITQTGSIGQGRNYTQQLLGAYDASASVNFEISDLSFFRYAIGDESLASLAGGSAAAPYHLIESELFGTDAATGLTGAPSTWTKIRVRPFSMMLYDLEQAESGSSLYDSVDLLSGCAMNDFSISASVGSPLQGSANLTVKEIMHKRNLGILNPSFAGTAAMIDAGLAEPVSSGASQSYADSPPYMFYGGSIIIDGYTIGQVTSFNYNYSNSLITYRALGSRFIEMPQVGMRRQTLSVNAVLKVDTDAGLVEGTPSTIDGIKRTNILELIKNYFGYASTEGISPTTVLRPAQAAANTQMGSTQVSGSSTLSAGSSIVSPIEKTKIELLFNGSTAEMLTAIGTTKLDATLKTKNAKITVRNCAIDNFGVPVQLENGLIEVPISFSVRGQKYTRIGDGSFNGYIASGGDTQSSTYNPIISWWYTA